MLSVKFKLLEMDDPLVRIWQNILWCFRVKSKEFKDVEEVSMVCKVDKITGFEPQSKNFIWSNTFTVANTFFS